MEKTEMTPRKGTGNGSDEGAPREQSVFRRAARVVLKESVDLLKSAGLWIIEFIMHPVMTCALLFFSTAAACTGCPEFALPGVSVFWVLMPLVGLETKHRALSIVVSVAFAVLLIPLCAYCLMTGGYGSMGRELAGYAFWVLLGGYPLFMILFAMAFSSGEEDE